MMSSTKKIGVLNMVTSLTIFILLFVFSATILNAISQFFVLIMYPIAYIYSDPLDYIILALFPYASYFLYRDQIAISYKTIILANLLTIVSLILTCVIALVLAACFMKAESPLIPTYFIIIPFPVFFWKIIFIIGLLIPPMLKKLRPLFHRTTI